MQWNDTIMAGASWERPITNKLAKQAVAKKLAKRLRHGDVVGVGSGSTSYLTLVALAARRQSHELDFRAIVTSIEMELACQSLNIPTTSLLVEKPDWSFDGADEIDPKGRMIKGRGGAMAREKLLMQASPEIYVVIDASKRVKTLGQKFPVPIEILPYAMHIVGDQLRLTAGVEQITLRQATAKDGPVITEAGNLILDVRFSHISGDMESQLKTMVGVVETGLFTQFKVQVIEMNEVKKSTTNH